MVEGSSAPVLAFEVVPGDEPGTLGLDRIGRVVADENYILESIEQPAAKVRVGFQPAMPSFKLHKFVSEKIVESGVYLSRIKGRSGKVVYHPIVVAR